MADVDDIGGARNNANSPDPVSAGLINEIKSLIVIVTGCLAFLIVIIGVIILMAFRIIQPTELGNFSGITAGGGLVGFAALSVAMVRTVFKAKEEQ